MREGSRSNLAGREVKIVPGFLEQPGGNALISFGQTRVLCSANIEQGVPRWRDESGLGWLTAEYAMMPASTAPRSKRERSQGRISGRSQEIQRLIGRSLRASLDFKRLGQRTIWVDCDVLEADGGTRTAAITGAYVAVCLALKNLGEQEGATIDAIPQQVAAVSVGLVGGEILVDLDYKEDSGADVDLNVVMLGTGGLIEVQGTAERSPFSRADLDGMLDAAAATCEMLFVNQREALR